MNCSSKLACESRSCNASLQAQTHPLRSYRMTGMVLGRPTSPTSRPVTEVGLTIIIMFAIVTIPFVAAKAVRLYVETLELTVFKGDPAAPHIIVTGDVTEARIRAFLAQLYHESRRFAIQIGPRVVILSPKGSTAGLLELIDQTRFGGNITFIKGSALNQSDLARASATNASTMLFLTSRLEAATTTDATTLAACLSAKNYNPSLRLLVQLRQQRTQQQLATIPAWSHEDRSIVLPNFTHTLLGVGALVPGLPALVAMLIQQGSGTAAEKALKQRHGSSWGAMSSQLAFTGTQHSEAAVGADASGQGRSDRLWPLDVMQQVSSLLDDNSNVEKWSLERCDTASGSILNAAADTSSPSEEGTEQSCCRRQPPPSHVPRAIAVPESTRIALLLGAGNILDERRLSMHVSLPAGGSAGAAAVAQLRQPWQHAISKSPLQEFAAGFSQELHEVRLTPGLAFRSFGAAARMVYLRYHILLLAARVRSDATQQPSKHYKMQADVQRTARTAPSKRWEAGLSTDVRLFPCKLLLDPASVVSLYAVAPSEDAIARLQTDTSYDWLRVMRYSNACLQLGVSPSPIAPPLPNEMPHTNGNTVVGWKEDRERVMAAASWTYHWFGLPHAYASALAKAEFSLASPWPWLRLTDARLYPRAAAVQRPLCFGACCGSLCCTACALQPRQLDGDTIWNCNGGPSSEPARAQAVSASMALYSNRSGAPELLRAPIQVVPPLALSDPASLPAQYRRVLAADTAQSVLSGAVDSEEVGVIGLSHSVASDVLSAFSSRGSVGAASAPTTRPQVQPGARTTQAAAAPNSHRIPARPRRPSVLNRAAPSPGRQRASSTASTGAGGAAGIGGSLSNMAQSAPAAAPNALRDHILICGASANMGLLLRSLRSVPYDPPFCTHRVFLKPPSQGGTAETLLGRGARVADAPETNDGEESVASFTSIAAGKGTAAPQLHWKVVVLCPKAHRPDFATDSKLSGSNSAWLAQVQWIDGSPLALEDLVRAGALAARSAIVLANDGGFQGKGAASSPLLDDVDAISVASGLYKLNPSLHVVTQLQHGSSAAFLRPSGSSLSSAQEYTTEYVAHLTQQIQSASEKFAKQMAQQRARQAAAESALASIAGPQHDVESHSGTRFVGSPQPRQHAGPGRTPSPSQASSAAAIPEAPESEERDSDQENTPIASTAADLPNPASLLTAEMGSLSTSGASNSLAAAQELLQEAQRDRQRPDASDSSDSDVGDMALDEQPADVYCISSDSEGSRDAPELAGDGTAAGLPLSPAGRTEQPTSPTQHPKAHRRGWSLLRNLVQDGKQGALQTVTCSPSQAAKAAAGSEDAAASTAAEAAEAPPSKQAHTTESSASNSPGAVATVSRAGILGVLSDVVTSGALEGAVAAEPQSADSHAAARSSEGPPKDGQDTEEGSTAGAQSDWKPPPVPSATEQKQVLRDIVELAAKCSSAEAIGEQLLEQHMEAQKKRTAELELLAESSAAGGASVADAFAVPLTTQQQSPILAPITAANSGAYGGDNHRGSLTADDLDDARPSWGMRASAAGSQGGELKTPRGEVPTTSASTHSLLPDRPLSDQCDVIHGLESFPYTSLLQQQNSVCQVPSCPELAFETAAAQASDTHVLSSAASETHSIAQRTNAPQATQHAIRAHMAGFLPGVAPGSIARPSALPRSDSGVQDAPPSDESFKALDENMQSGNESIGDKLFTSKTSQQARRAARAAAEADLFGAPAFAAGRAFSATTLDALVVEAFYTPHAISLVKRLVRASRKQRLQLVPAQEALFMVRWFSPSFSTYQHEISGEGQSTGSEKLPPAHWPMEHQHWPLVRFGQLSEALLRGWHLLSLGLYRRRSPQSAPGGSVSAAQQSEGGQHSPTPAQHAAALLEGQLPSTDGPFKHSRELISYVYTNPPPHTILTPYDYIYVLRAHGED